MPLSLPEFLQHLPGVVEGGSNPGLGGVWDPPTPQGAGGDGKISCPTSLQGRGGGRGGDFSFPLFFLLKSLDIWNSKPPAALQGPEAALGTVSCRTWLLPEPGRCGVWIWGMLVPETPAAFPREKPPGGFQCLIWGLAWDSGREFFQAVVGISVKQKEKTAKGLSWLWFGAPQLRQAGHRWGEEEEGTGKMWVVMLKH